jgi:dTMP kinase
MDKKLICITGSDGCGKSTLIKGLAQNTGSLYIATIWDLMNGDAKGLPFKSKSDIDNFLCELTSGSRLLFLAHAMKYAIDMAFNSMANTIIVDSYYYKYFASELALGADRKLVSALQNAFPPPDQVFFLQLECTAAVQRKVQFSKYECGLENKAGELSFIAFQQKIKKEWEFFDKKNWITIDAKQSPEQVLKQVLEKINL